MLLKEEELQRLIKEECIKVINEGLPSVIRRAVTGVFGDADPRAARLIQGLEQSPGILDMPAGELRSTFRAMEIDKADEVAREIARIACSSSGVITVADSLNSVFAHADITACTAYTINNS